MRVKRFMRVDTSAVNIMALAFWGTNGVSFPKLKPSSITPSKLSKIPIVGTTVNQIIQKHSIKNESFPKLKPSSITPSKLSKIPIVGTTVNQIIQKHSIKNVGTTVNQIIQKHSIKNESFPKLKAIIQCTNITKTKCKSEFVYKNKSGIYVLELTDGFIYVGKSKNIPKRIAQHMAGRGARFTRIFKPTGKVLPRLGSIQCELGDAAERDETLRQMYKYGVDRVRGWKFCSQRLRLCDRAEIESNIRELFDLCRKCGKTGHFAASCTAKIFKKVL
jgi:predicted GIY-YIG superfamily endonuclease